MVTVLLSPWLPESSEQAARRARRPRPLAGGRRARRRPRAARQPARAAVPQALVIDSHTHLDSCEPPDAELVAAATAAGVTRILTVGMDERDVPRARSPRARRSRRSTPPSAGTPTTPRASTTPRWPSSRTWPRTALRGDRRDRPGLLPRLRAARRPGARVPRADRARARDRQAARHPHARGGGRHDRDARARAPTGLAVILHCFSMPGRLDECLAEGWWISFAGNVTYPKAQDLAGAAERVPGRAPAGRDRRALPDAPGRAQGAQPAGVRRLIRRSSWPNEEA